MSNEHTPGPWSVHVDDTEPAFPRFHVNCRGIRSIAIMTGCGYSPLRDENEANARLIAAAPEMLAALERLVEHADLGEVDLESEERDALDQARAVIAKAKGEA